MKSYSVRPLAPSTIDENLALYSPFVRGLLFARGVETAPAAEEFLNPSYEKHFHDPFLLPDMEKAVSRILAGMKRDERIVIWSDYDSDGIPGGALLYDFFKKIGYKNFTNYIPHRYTEGYGLNSQGLEKLKAEGASIIITVDSGITDHAPASRALELGMDLIITDHHLPAETLPEAYAVINVKRKDNAYPFPELCGAATAWKLAQALIMRGDFNLPLGWEKWLLDLAGLATIADMMPLVGENRALAHFGLVVLRKSPRLGLMKLCRMMRTNQRLLTEDDVGFMIAPRINAASRMDHPEEAFKLLTTENEDEAERLAKHLNRINDERKGVVASTVKEIKKRIANVAQMREVIVMGNPKWRPGLLGLAANSLAEEFNRPVFLWGREGGEVLKGSCRSDGRVNVVELMGAAREVFVEFGGHKFSGGFSVVHEKVHALEEALIVAYQAIKIEGEIIEEVQVDAKLSLEEVTFETYAQVERLAPFGMGNPKPLFLFENIEIKNVRQFGKENQHLELMFEDFDGKKIPAISFFTTPDQFGRTLEAGRTLTLLANLEKSTFKHTPELRLRIVDIV